MKTRKGGGSESKKALNCCKQGRQTANENVAGTLSKDVSPATRPVNANPRAWPPRSVAESIGSSLTEAKFTFSHIIPAPRNAY